MLAIAQTFAKVYGAMPTINPNTRNVTPVCQEGSHNQAVMEESVKQFTDCKYLVASRIGSGAIQALTAAGITGMELPGSIDEAMLRVWKYNRVQGLFN